MTLRSRRRMFFFLIVSTSAFLGLQLSGIGLEDFDNAGQMQDNHALPTGRNNGNKLGQGAQDSQSSRNTLMKQFDHDNNVNNHLIVQKDRLHTNHDRLMVRDADNAIHLRNLAASKLQENADNESGALSDNPKTRSAPPAPLVSVANAISSNNMTKPQATKQSSNVMRTSNLASVYQTVPPSIFQEENCPVCFGTSLCDQFYAGNIKWNKSSVTTPQKNVQMYEGMWLEDGSPNGHRRVTIKQFSNHRVRFIRITFVGMGMRKV